MNRSLCCLVTLAALGMAAVPAGAAPAFEPQGELAARIDLIRARILRGDVPTLTPEFILADIALRPDYPRRFSEYSGDVSGRYIGALSCVPVPKADLDGILAQALTYQKADGRFGDDTLEFTPDKVGFNHMALLWGNGRLLVGLLEYNDAHPNPAALDSARRLGDFLRAAYNGCANEEVARRVKDLGAAGMICFTQLIEGLVMLADATGDRAYLDTAESIVPWFQQDRGTQHSHGYLSTLRGILMLHEATGKPEHLKLVEDLYASLVNSPDYKPYGGVNEYFGDKGDRDEGCSEADFLRLSLNLWRVTGKRAYLDKAEHILANQFSANQFPSGDFGHHGYFAKGVMPVVGEGRAWWCCTWHGLRAYRDVFDSVVTEKDGLVRVSLFESGKWTGGDRAVTLDWNTAAVDAPLLSVTVAQAPADGLRLAVRKPAWCTGMNVTVAATPAEVREEDGYLVFAQPLKAGDRATLKVNLLARIVKRDHSAVAPEQLTAEPVEGMLMYGPWILGVAGVENPGFLGEPWAGNRILLPARVSAVNDGGRIRRAPVSIIRTSVAGLNIDTARIWADYHHESFPGTYEVLLRPMAERTLHETTPFLVWLNYCSQSK